MPLQQVMEQGPQPELPGWALIAMCNPIHQLSQLGRRYGDLVADLMRKALPGSMTVLHGREHGAQEQQHAVGILVVPIEKLRYQFARLTTDGFHRTGTVKFKTIRPIDT